MRIGIGIGIGFGRGGASGPSLNAPTLAVQESGSDTHAETEPADLVAHATVDDGDGFVTTNVQLYSNGVLVASMTNDGGGAWSYAIDDVAAGTYSYTARRVTASGSVDSAAWVVVVSASGDFLLVSGDPLTVGGDALLNG